MSPDLVRHFFKVFGNDPENPPRNLCNFYGSTEMIDVTYSVFTSISNLEKQLDKNGKVPIGKPIFNSSTYVLDEQMQPVTLGNVGQMYISSANLCDGYVGTKHSSFQLNKVHYSY